MNKILEKEFRNELYKNLCEAGYEKQEAQKIVSVKYRDTLKGKLIESLHTQIDSIEDGKNELIVNAEELANGLSELTKLNDFFKKLEKKFWKKVPKKFGY